MMQSNEVAMAAGESCGVRLRHAREHAGLSREDVSARLKVPLRVLEAMEADDTSRLGAPVFVRGHLRSYARLLDLDLEDQLSNCHAVPPVMPPELVSYSHTPRYRRVLEQFTRRAVYIVMTAAIAVPVWLATRPHLSTAPAVQSLDVPAEVLADLAPKPSVAVPAAPSKTAPAASAERKPLMASIASMQADEAQAPVPAEPGLSLEFSGDSWVQVFSTDGEALEQGVLSAGDHRSYAPGSVGRVVLGNTAAVDVRRDGEAIDLAPFSRANVARFTLSSDGSLAPVAR